MTSSVSLVAVLLTSATVFELPQISIINRGNTFQLEQQYISLNLANPQLKLTSQQNNLLAEHLGCSCSLCTQTINNINV